MHMKIVSKDQTDYMNLVMDYILSHPAISVAEIKQRFHLTDEEYNMCIDLCMPSVRRRVADQYWRSKYCSILTSMEDAYKRILSPDAKLSLKKEIELILKANGKDPSKMFANIRIA